MELRTPALQRLYRDWERWRGVRPFPASADIDPLDLRYILGNVSLTSVRYDPLRFHYRIHATASSGRLGFDLTNKSLDALPNERYREYIREHFLEALEIRRPVIKHRERVLANKEFWFLEALVLPFSDDAQTIDMLMSATHFDVPKSIGPKPVTRAQFNYGA